MPVGLTGSPLPLAASLGTDLLQPAGALAAVLATAGLILVLPLFLNHRRELHRLLAWQKNEPERGDQKAELAAAEAAAVATAATQIPAGQTMTAAERVTAERPALARVTTSERALIEQGPFVKRVLALGPRHPLVISIGTLLSAGVIFVVLVQVLNFGGGEGQSTGFDRSSIEVTILNGSSSPGLAKKIADSLAAESFSVAGTGAAPDSSGQTVVRFDTGHENDARKVAKDLSVDVVQPFDQQTRAAADGASVVVIAGEDRARA